MSFSEELQRRRLIARPYIEFAPEDNPSVSGYIGPGTNLYGFADDVAGVAPVKGTALTIGQFTRAVCNDRLPLETPQASISLVDKGNQWKRWANRNWVLPRRKMRVKIRLKNPDETYTDGELFQGLSKDITFEDGTVDFTLYDTFGEVFNESIPAEMVDLESWPFAHSNAVGKPYPIVYGKMDNSLEYVENFRGTLSEPSGAVVTDFAANVVSGAGESLSGVSYTYGIAPFDGVGDIIGQVTTVEVAVSGIHDEVVLTWNYSGPAASFRIWRTTNGFLQMTYTLDSTYIPVGTTTFTDSAPGYELPPTLPQQFIISYRQSAYYYISAVVGGLELTTGPVYIGLTPLNFDAIRYVTLNWDAVPGATSIIIRRGLQTYGWAVGIDHEWTIAGTATTFLDWLSDPTLGASTEPPFIDNTRPGALQCLYADTNLAGTSTFRYVACRGAAKLVRNVYVTKTPITERGTPKGSIERPNNVTVTIVGTLGTLNRRYRVTAVNEIGETTASNSVHANDCVDPMDGSNYVTLTWEAIEGALSYRVYRADPKTDFGFIVGTTDLTVDDTGFTPDLTQLVPEANTTGEHFENSEGPTREIPMRQTEGVDYSVSLVTVDGVLCTVLDFALDQGDHDVTADIWGIETAGDGTGDLIEGYFEQFHHFLCNFVFANYLTGAWFTSSPYVDSPSFTLAQSESEGRIATGYIGAGALVEPTTNQQAIYDWVAGTDVDLYYWEGLLKVSLPRDPDTIDRTVLTRMTMQDGILLDAPFRSVIDDTQVFNEIPWQAGPQYQGFRLSGRSLHPTSASRYGTRISPLMSYFWIRGLGTLVDVVEIKRVAWAKPKVYASYKAPIRTALKELAQPLLVTHPDGISDSETGWHDRLAKLIRADVDPASADVNVTVEDLESVETEDTSGAMFKYLRFTKASGTGTQTITGVGFEGKALLIWSTHQGSFGADTGAFQSFGIAASDYQACRFIRHPGGETNTTSAQAEQTDHIAYKVSATSGATPSLQATGVFTGFTDDGFTINWTVNDGVNDIFHAVVIGGDGVDAAVRSLKITGATNVVNDLGSGFTPDSFVVLGGAADEFGSGDYSLGAPFGSITSFGFSNGPETGDPTALNNVCAWTLGRGTGGAADSARGDHSDLISSVRIANFTGAGVFMNGRISAVADGGYTVTRVATGGGSQPRQHILALKGVRMAIRRLTAPSATGEQVIPLPFQTALLMAFTTGRSTNTNSDHLGLAMGAWQREDDIQGGTWIGGVDAASPSVYRRSSYDDIVIESRDRTTGAVEVQAGVVDASLTDLTLNFQAVAGNSEAVYVIAMAGVAS